MLSQIDCRWAKKVGTAAAACLQNWLSSGFDCCERVVLHSTDTNIVFYLFTYFHGYVNGGDFMVLVHGKIVLSLGRQFCLIGVPFCGMLPWLIFITEAAWLCSKDERIAYPRKSKALCEELI